MTLVLTLNGRESIWLLADRRLTLNGQPSRDDARKVMVLDTTDGVAILGYSGLGATALGTEPADWMGAVLRGRNLPLEASLAVLADAMRSQLPRHLVHLGGNAAAAHNVMVTALIGSDIRLYTIDIVLTPDGQSFHFRFTRHLTESVSSPEPRTPRIGIAGTGALYLARDRAWIRPLLHVANACDRARVSPHTVADHLAKLNNRVHLGVLDKSVGPRCIVVWRHRKEGVHKGRGAQQSYTGTSRDSIGASLPSIARGMDLSAILGVLFPHVEERSRMMQEGGPLGELDIDEINTELGELPDEPDEQLR
jgi:hypothetical protein